MQNETLYEIDSLIANIGGFITIDTKSPCVIIKPCGTMIKARANGKVNEGEKLIYKVSKGGQTISKMDYVKQRRKHESSFELSQDGSWHERVEGFKSLVTNKRTKQGLYLITCYDSSHDLAKPRVTFEDESGTILDRDIVEAIRAKIARAEQNPTPVRVFKPKTMTRVAIGKKVFTA